MSLGDRPAALSVRRRKKYGSVPFWAAIFLPTRSVMLLAVEPFATTSAVHSGCSKM